MMMIDDLGVIFATARLMLLADDDHDDHDHEGKVGKLKYGLKLKGPVTDVYTKISGLGVLDPTAGAAQTTVLA